MARTKTAAQPTHSAAEATLEHDPAITPGAEATSATATQEPRQANAERAASQSAYAPDPTPQISVSLSDASGGPAMHLLRSHRYRQMHVKFEGEQPEQKHVDMLKHAGWTDRTATEGVFTKQIDSNARWQSVQKMEQEFRDVANAIRTSKGLQPALEGLGA